MKLHAELLNKQNLTPRESEVFQLLCSGLSDKAIANQLGIHTKVVSKNIDRIYEKLGIRWQSINTRCTAIGIAVASGMVKMVLRSVVAVLVFQSSMVYDNQALRVRTQTPRTVKTLRTRVD